VENLDIKQSDGSRNLSRRRKRQSVSIIRYADYFVIIHEQIEVVEKCKERINRWLESLGLELKPSKTRIAHTVEEYKEEKAGFDFLGFNIKQYKVGKYTTGKDTNGKPLGFKTIIKPSKKSIKSHYQKVAEIIDKFKGETQFKLIKELNPVIKG